MAKATSNRITKLSDLISDRVVREAWQRAERDYGQTFAIPDQPLPRLDGGALAARELEEVS